MLKALLFLLLLVPGYFAVRWLGQRLGNGVIGLHQRMQQRLHPVKTWALALAWPMAHAQLEHGFEEDDSSLYDPQALSDLRQGLLLQLGWDSATPEAELRARFARQAPQHWYRWDIEQLTPKDNWRDGLALACARTAFALRVAYLLGWLDNITQWQLLTLNAQRAQMCFDSWQDWASACARGRQQWIARSRTDDMGTPFGPDDIQTWLAQSGHPWRQLPWRLPLPTPPAARPT